MEQMIAVWAQGLSGEKNVSLAFVLEFQEKQAFSMRLSAADCYQVYLDGEFLAFGPQRAAHGYARISHYQGEAKRIVVEVHSHCVETFCWIRQMPFFACEVTAGDACYGGEDFACYRLTDRVQRVPRYSFQRSFSEVYRMQEDRRSLYVGCSSFPKMAIERVPAPTFLPAIVDEPKYGMHYPMAVVEKGSVTVDETLPVWRNRAHTQIGSVLQGFTIDECEEIPTDEVSQFVYHPGECTGALQYVTYDFGRAITGFTGLKIKAKKAGSVYFVFDEILWKEKGKGDAYVSFERNACSSVHKWILEKEGEYDVTTFEPYLVRYALVVFSDGLEVELSHRDYENPNADKFVFHCDDERVQKIVEAARASFAQNAVDLLMDCPSRERAGWLSDSYFSSETEYILTGDNQAERAFLENYALADCSRLPKGMVPMCYPSDQFRDGQYIPNWAMWYILELEKYEKRWGRDAIIEKSKEKVDGLLSYFAGKENEFGLLEDLEGWVFVEWSDANKPEHIKGVNIPSNITYASCLEAASALYGYEGLQEKAQNIRAYIKANAYDGKFFVDNLLRDDEGKLVQSGLLTEVCQYYAFWFGCITKEEYPALYEELMQRLGVKRQEGYLPHVGVSNVLYGLYMRIDLLMREGKKADVMEECLKLFLPMAERTGTLWEHNGISASCNHGFASYALKWILFALHD